MMEQEPIVYQLKNLIAKKRFVNYCSRKFFPGNQEELDHLFSNLKEGAKNIYVEIDIREFENCETEEDEITVLLESINKELTAKGLSPFQGHAYSMATALFRWSETLDTKTLLIFHCFHDRYNEKEKDILRSLRKALRDKDELSAYLGILIISNRKVSSWELFPESNLDDRHVEFFEY
ncbi:MAG TPA: hypothetical protein VK469_11460 [Candidatus Kapabacteria bacterium]|nr:hypothetical protein [Candidatus Kapabacteria bacterium]